MKKILVIDDDQDIVELVEMILSSNGYEVITHNTGFDVLTLVEKNRPDLILLDIMLPGKLGTEICKDLKAISDLPTIILFSAHAKEKDTLETCKADAFIAKPFDLQNFLSVINSHAA